MKEFMIIVDMQNDFYTGSLLNPAVKSIIEPICQKIEYGKRNGVKFIATKDTHMQNSYLQTTEGKNLPVMHTIKGTDGWEIIKEIKDCLPEDTFIVCKTSLGYPGSRWKIIFEWLGDVTYNDEFIVTFVGTLTEMCVLSNAIIIRNEFPQAHIRVISQCCAGLTQKKHEDALKVMENLFIEVV